MKKIFLYKLKEEYSKIPRICPHCDDYLFPNDDNTIKICKKCNLMFEFELEIHWLSSLWYIRIIKVLDDKK